MIILFIRNNFILIYSVVLLVTRKMSISSIKGNFDLGKVYHYIQMCPCGQKRPIWQFSTYMDRTFECKCGRTHQVNNSFLTNVYMGDEINKKKISELKKKASYAQRTYDKMQNQKKEYEKGVKKILMF